MLASEYFTKDGQENKWLRIGRHILFWAGHVFYHVATYGVYEDDTQRSFVILMLSLPGKLIMTYYLLYHLLPNFLLKKRYRQFFGYFLLMLFATGLLNRAISFFVVYPIYYPDAIPYGYWRIKIFFEMTAINSIAAMAMVIKLLQYWYKNEQSRKQLAEQKLAAELQLLKSQIHPHFLFNTLNNLYALTLENAKTAPQVVLKLSALINYMLYECNAPFVPLEKELKYIENYISLERLRYGSRLDLSVEIAGDTHQKLIAPLLLIPFIENSFKHGASQEAKSPWVHLNIWVNQHQLQLQLENSLPPKTTAPLEYTKGIGLKNVKRRLELLYQGKYELTIREEGSYLVNLKLALSDA